jgi:hypothetical protein
VRWRHCLHLAILGVAGAFCLRRLFDEFFDFAERFFLWPDASKSESPESDLAGVHFMNQFRAQIYGQPFKKVKRKCNDKLF